MQTDAEISAKREREVEDLTATIMGLMADMVVEQKRRVVEEVDKLVAAEEATHAIAAGQQH